MSCNKTNNTKCARWKMCRQNECVAIRSDVSYRLIYVWPAPRELAIWKTSETISQWYFERVNSPRSAPVMVQVSLSSNSKCCLFISLGYLLLLFPNSVVSLSISGRRLELNTKNFCPLCASEPSIISDICNFLCESQAATSPSECDNYSDNSGIPSQFSLQRIEISFHTRFAFLLNGSDSHMWDQVLYIDDMRLGQQLSNLLHN